MIGQGLDSPSAQDKSQRAHHTYTMYCCTRVQARGTVTAALWHCHLSLCGIREPLCRVAGYSHAAHPAGLGPGRPLKQTDEHRKTISQASH